ncbi:hypothetical protein HA050_14660 [Iodobacter sp. HSC-16F04]|uniref:DUF4440 domain-containing protein n=1 Tax=Iodobacter violaceini TaxID=3044271 RepID=A0ABX0KRS3_9NEIS|nr:hypothetical protein [Iodobacter violacea]NHQ87355.1 hypothetical protein [Iodobacter violacea]
MMLLLVSGLNCGKCYGGIRFLQEVIDIERLPFGPAPIFYPQNFTVVELAPSVLQVTFRLITLLPATDDASYFLRSSLWRLAGGEWKMIFHQGTHTDAFEKA